MQPMTMRDERMNMPTGALTAFAIVSSDGIKLDAIVHRPDAPTGSVLLAHGFSADLHEEGAFDLLTERLVDTGIAVVRFSFRGHGKSEGAQTEMTITGERRDLIAAYEWMTENLPGPYGLLGASFGGVSTTLEHENLRPKPSFLALWNPALEIGHVFGSDLLDGARRTGYVQVNPNFRIGLPFIEEREYYHGNLGLHHLGGVPALIVHGTNDVQVPLASSIAAATVPHVDLVILHGASHGFHDPRWEEEAVRVTVDWVKHHLTENGNIPAAERIPHQMAQPGKPGTDDLGWTEYRPYRPVSRTDD